MTEKRIREAFTRTIQQAADEAKPRQPDHRYWHWYYWTLRVILADMEEWGYTPWRAINEAKEGLTAYDNLDPTHAHEWLGANAAIHYARGALHAHGGDPEGYEGGML